MRSRAARLWQTVPWRTIVRLGVRVSLSNPNLNPNPNQVPWRTMAPRPTTIQSCVTCSLRGKRTGAGAQVWQHSTLALALPIRSPRSNPNRSRGPFFALPLSPTLSPTLSLSLSLTPTPTLTRRRQRPLVQPRPHHGHRPLPRRTQRQLRGHPTLLFRRHQPRWVLGARRSRWGAARVCGDGERGRGPY